MQQWKRKRKKRNRTIIFFVLNPLITCDFGFVCLDLYQITMAYAYWKSGKMDDRAIFDLFFRRNPFQGEFTLFAGLEECVKLLQNFRFSESGE